MSARPLKSDQVNYLIWRYLQESGHAQTAARLQRDWGRVDPQALPFAQHIRTHALVHLLQKGLRYHELESSIDQNGQTRPPSYFFGPDSGSASPPQGDIDDEEAGKSRKHLREAGSLDADAIAQAPSAKRSRRSNGAINGRSRGGGDGMDLDPSNAQHPDPATKRESAAANAPGTSPSAIGNHAANSEMELDSGDRKVGDMSLQISDHAYRAGEGAAPRNQEAEPGETLDTATTGTDAQSEAQARTPSESPAHRAAPPVINIVPTLVNGSSVGVQSDKGAELGPETGVLGVPGKNVTHALWSPRDPSLLAGAGDALCRLWSVPTTTTSTTAAAEPPAATDDAPNGFTADKSPPPRPPRPIEPSSAVDLNENSDAYYVTSIAWSNDGSYLAVAKHPVVGGQLGVVAIYDKHGVPMDELPGSQDFVLNLMWSPQSTLLLGISYSGDNASTVMAWDAHGARVIEPLRVGHKVWDASWVDERHFFICASDFVAKAEVQTSSVVVVSERTGPGATGEWSRIKHDVHSGTTSVTADGSPGILGVYGPQGNFHKIEAHSADITALVYQPLANPAAARSQPNAPRLLATASVDGHAKLWNANRPIELVHTLDMGKASPVLALSFTPDGFLVAAASADKVLFWNAETGGFPKAAWYGKDIGWHGSDTAHLNGNGHSAENGDVEMTDGDEEDPVPTLSWDADGKKLVCGVRNQLAIISLRR